VHVAHDVTLDEANTLALPCVAAAHVRLETAADLADLGDYLRHQQLPALVLGEGSNVVLPGRLQAVVVQLATTGIELSDLGDSRVAVRVAGGENWHGLVTRLLAEGVHGLENLALIPGTVGAAPVQNIGAYGVELSRFLQAVEVVELATGEQQTLSAGDCELRYRDSIFRHRARGRYLITAVQLELSREPVVEAGYDTLAERLTGAGITSPTPADIFRAVVAIRRARLPDPARIPNVGSFFKNPVVGADLAASLARRFPGLVQYPQGDGSAKLAAGWLVEHAGWKGRGIGPAATHDVQALVLVNRGGADCDDILQLAATVRGAVHDRFGVDLQREPVLFGSDGSYIEGD
jgi:UDP-N-acetylmuramate dehydrogenase